VKSPSGILTKFLDTADELAAELNAIQALESALKESDATVLFNAVRDAWPKVRETQVAKGVRDELADLLVERVGPTIAVTEALQSALHGRVELATPGAADAPKSDRVVAITYDFTDSAAAQDFVPREVPGEIDQRTLPLSESRRQKALEEAKQLKAWSLSGGHLCPVADGYCEFRIPFRGDVDVEVTTTLDESKAQSLVAYSAKTVLWFGIRSDDSGELGAVIGQSEFVVGRRGIQPTRRRVSDQIPSGSLVGRLRLNRRMLSFSRAGGPPVSDPFLFAGTAHLFFYAPGSDAWRIDRLVVRATVDDSDLQSLSKDAAVARVNAALVRQ
jgi:hypothetical protein